MFDVIYKTFFRLDELKPLPKLRVKRSQTRYKSNILN